MLCPCFWWWYIQLKYFQPGNIISVYFLIFQKDTIFICFQFTKILFAAYFCFCFSLQRLSFFAQSQASYFPPFQLLCLAKLNEAKLSQTKRCLHHIYCRVSTYYRQTNTSTSLMVHPKDKTPPWEWWRMIIMTSRVIAMGQKSFTRSRQVAGRIPGRTSASSTRHRGHHLPIHNHLLYNYIMANS